MKHIGRLLSDLLIGEVTYKRAPSLKQLINQAYARGGRTWKGAATWLGVSESTLYRWRHGSAPSGPKLDQAREKAATLRRRRVRKPIPDSSTRIQWIFDGRDRNYEISSLRLEKGALKRVQDALIMDPEGFDEAARQFLHAITDPWYRTHFTTYQTRAKAEEYAEEHQGELPTEQEMADYYDDLIGEMYDQYAAEDNEEYGFDVAGFAHN